MVDYETLMLRKACEELALKCVILGSRLDDVEASMEHVRRMAFNAAFEVAKAQGNPEAEPVVDPGFPTP